MAGEKAIASPFGQTHLKVFAVSASVSEADRRLKCREGVDQAIGVGRLVGSDRLGGNAGEQRLGVTDIRRLPRRQAPAGEGAEARILAVGPPRERPSVWAPSSFRAPAAWRCTRMTVLSVKTVLYTPLRRPRSLLRQIAPRCLRARCRARHRRTADCPAP
jgi:hypothetical protein